MNMYWILGIVALVVAVALIVYFATRQQPGAGGLFGTGIGGTGSGTAIGSSLGNLFTSLGGVAATTGATVDAARQPASTPPTPGVA